MASLRYDNGDLPEHMREGVKLYIERGIPPGSFLTAIICNDLREACGRADYINQHRIFEIVRWFWNEAPSPCWGSAERMKSWMAQFRNVAA